MIFVFVWLHLLHLVWSSLDPSILLQIALFHCFLRLSNIPLCVYVCVCVCVLHIVCFHVVAVINSAAVNTEVLASFWISVFLFLDICPGMGLLDHMVTLVLVFYGTSILFSLVAAPIYIPINYVLRRVGHDWSDLAAAATMWGWFSFLHK